MNSPVLGPSVIFEAFEASARNEDILAANDALQWNFPGSAVAVSSETFYEEGFITNLARFLEHASRESSADYSALAFKADRTVSEERDSVEPCLITSLLMAILQENGRRISPIFLQKKVRDDVCWSNAAQPWKRLPFWLVLRVAVGRILAETLGGDLGLIDYKFLIAHVLSHFIGQVRDSSLDVYQLCQLKTKLCRRLAKLDLEKGRSQSPRVSERIDHYFTQLEKGFNGILKELAEAVDTTWQQQKLSMTRTILPLVRKANPGDLKLELRVSGPQLWSILSSYDPYRKRTPLQRKDFSIAEAAKQHMNESATQQSKLIDEEAECAAFFQDTSPESSEQICKSASKLITTYVRSACQAYKGNGELQSQMILTVMELWIKMDYAICDLFSLVSEYHPIFRPDMLNVLLFSSFEDMERLQRVQNCLHHRVSSCKTTKGLFSDPTDGCFAHRSFEESPDSARLQKLHDRIEDWATELRLAKAEEWNQKSRQFENLWRQIDTMTCIFVVDEYEPFGRGKHSPHCTRCQLMRQQSQIRIQTYEHPLPSDPVSAKVAVFEIQCPETFALYRDSTWFILNQLALAPKDKYESEKPKCRLRDYEQLARFANQTDSKLSLASQTKSFIQTHYDKLRFPVEWEGSRDSVCRPNGLRLAYFDTDSSSWPGRSRFQFSFAHHVRLQIPDSSPFFKLLEDEKFRNYSYGPSSYETMASAANCPPGINANEFLAFQTVASGKNRRWLAILTELGSSNLNFSNEATAILLHQVALQCGPSEDKEDPLRQTHSIFRDEAFGERLADQLSQRLGTLSTNWRETHLMETIITLALRLTDLAAAAGLLDLSLKASSILLRAREISVRWFRDLRTETLKTTDVKTAQRFQQYALWAALLCKRTFMIHSFQENILDDVSMATFIQSSMVVQDNLVVKTSSLPSMLQHAVVRDLRMTYKFRTVVADSIVSRPEIFCSAIKEMWPETEGCPRVLSSVRLNPNNWIWCLAKSSEEGTEQRVWFNVVAGILLVDGHSIGKLPKDPERFYILQELFGDHPLMTLPSDRVGMHYLLCVQPFGFQVHVGFDTSGEVIVRAYRGSSCLQLVPRKCFVAGQDADLPGPLVNDYFHWLDLNASKIYMTSKQKPWPVDHPFWGYTLDLRTGMCFRQPPLRGRTVQNTIVSPHSTLFRNIVRIMGKLETLDQILIIQPSGKLNVQVQLPRLQLLFFVNRYGLLESKQLQCEIDPNQDAGTWYGLREMLVCRNTINHRHRTILVPIGRLHAEKEGCHVRVQVQHSGSYGRFQINPLLGRVDSPSEPILVYTKAMLHAYTSSPISDPLTGRTGIEEAIEWLQSAICQPWSPLSQGSLERLEVVAKLAPNREYYPPDSRTMRTDQWDQSLPIWLQDSRLKFLVDKILDISGNLSVFAPNDSQRHQLRSIRDSGIHARTLLRQQRFERPLKFELDQPESTCYQYQSRDRISPNHISYCNVLETISLLRRQPAVMSTTTSLARHFQNLPSIGGYDHVFDKASLNDRLKVDLIQSWGSLVRFIREESNKYSLMFLLGPASFNAQADMTLIRTLIAFASFEQLRHIFLPPFQEYVNFSPGQTPQLGYLERFFEPFRHSRPEDDEDMLEEYASGQHRKRLRKERAGFAAEVDRDITYFAEYLLAQWPCAEPSLHGLFRSLFLDVGQAMQALRPEWCRMFQNMQLTSHLNEVQQVLDRHFGAVTYLQPDFVHSEDIHPMRTRGGETVEICDLLRKAGTTHEGGFGGGLMPLASPLQAKMVNGNAFPTWRQANATDISKIVQTSENREKSSGSLRKTDWSLSTQPSRSSQDLDTIIGKLGTSRSSVRQNYAAALQQSLQSYQQLQPANSHPSGVMLARPECIASEDSAVRALMDKIRFILDQPVANCSARRINLLKKGNLWPVINSRTMLRQLRSNAPHKHFGSGMRKLCVELGVKITQLQREIRLHDLALKSQSGRYFEELSNTGHSNWDPGDYTDWLLLEVESNLLIRPAQVDVALATISPASGSNSVLQMNMGQGKTSCIIPMVAAVLADRKQLVRVIVPKALLQQTAELLQARLGGILDRPLRHVPFARRTSTREATVRALLAIYKDTLKSAGVMICQPEHNLSFLLSGRQRLLDEETGQAGPMINVHSWLSKVSRDILDESDYTLAVRTQLIYPSGSQMTVDGHPHRWQVAEALLRLVNTNMYSLAREFPHSIEVVRRSGGGFPLLFFLRKDVEDELVARLTRDIYAGHGGILPMAVGLMTTKDRVAIKDFITADRPRKESIEAIRKLCPDMPSIKQAVYLLRGLLVNRILMMTLKKRWNVQYGLDPNRDPIAVPFHAKGVPSEQSEWGHPDVAILFTCLAFYYDGVSRAHLRQSVAHVLKSDDPAAEYDRWTQSTEDFPPSLRAWNSINMDDELQLFELWRSVRYNVVVIDYFLNNFVFPVHAKQFKVKLQSNGWDIPLSPLSDLGLGTDETGRYKPLTTGFSGTNDNRTMLPLTIKQQDLPSLNHTSAEVLTYLLQPRNRGCVLPRDLKRDGNNCRATEIDLLHGLKQKGIRVLIDAGAQILEMDNSRLVHEWLRIDGSALAAVYFDEKNRAWVLPKLGAKTPLLASPFADDLSKCLVYLDEAHTRGTDLKLPVDARGALTLGLGQTKDHTVQAAMRLRQLGTTQSVTFFIPQEVHQSIIDMKRDNDDAPKERIDSADVIEWLLENTCDGIEQLQPLYYSQGIDFCRRRQAVLDHPNFLTDRVQREAYIASIKHAEQQSLQQLYEPKAKTRSETSQEFTNMQLKGFVKELNKRKKTFQDTGKAVHASALQEVEQDRELVFEVESVRQVKKPTRYPALSFPGLHTTLRSFAKHGRIPADATCFTHILHSLSKTAVGRKFRVSHKASNSKIFVSAEFDRTVKLNVDLTGDNFIRPVNWVLWSPRAETAVVIIPEEAEALMPMMRDDSIEKGTHLLIYAAPTTRRMLHFNKFNYYSMPPLPSDWEAPLWLRLELGVYAGRLYFSWSEYEDLCKFLGVENGTHESMEDIEVDEGGQAEIQDGKLGSGLEGGQSSASDGHVAAPQMPNDTKKPETPQEELVSRPLTFIQEWLTLRRRGQDFAHSPMGLLAQGRLLQADHPFFRQETEQSQQQQQQAEPPSSDLLCGPRLTAQSHREFGEREADMLDSASGEAMFDYGDDLDGDDSADDDEDVSMEG